MTTKSITRQFAIVGTMSLAAFAMAQSPTAQPAPSSDTASAEVGLL